MAIKVQSVRKGYTDDYPDATSIVVDDTGHLLVKQHMGGTNSKTVAIYAPSTWSEAFVAKAE